MVGDLHFIIRHGLTGLAFLLFALFGIWSIELWFRDGCNIIAFLQPPLAKPPGSPEVQSVTSCTVIRLSSAAKDMQILLLALATLVGISLQGIQIFRRYTSNKLFKDRA